MNAPLSTLPEREALAESATLEVAALLEAASTVLLQSLRRGLANHAREAGAMEYDSWARAFRDPGAIEYDSWTIRS